jgi:ectoine hydroxylase-related dioxygenase (phytanoyl-CoA dioxygenase family)
MQLTVAQLDHFNDQGYLLLRQVLEPTDLDPVIDEYTAYIDQRAQELYAAGKIAQRYADASFEQRLALICRENNEIYSELDIMQRRGPASFAFLRHPKLLDIVECLVGSEITCSPIQHIRPKLPSGLTPRGSDPHVVHWHQDAGVTWAEADPVFIVTVWLPLVAATPENGCLRLMPGVHKQGLLRHRTKPGLGTAIAPEVLPQQKQITLPMQPGDLLLMHKHTPHCSTRNNTDGVRWSMDIRYQPTGTPTGRHFHPHFVARSHADPASVLTDHAAWDHLWAEALAQSKGIRVHRWQ